jgi:hypothetical protein
VEGKNGRNGDKEGVVVVVCQEEQVNGRKERLGREKTDEGEKGREARKEGGQVHDGREGERIVWM